MSASRKKKALVILSLLQKHYPTFRGGLSNYSTPFQMLVATILSAQSTDKQVNSITEELFTKYPSPEIFALTPLHEIEAAISKVGLYRNKAKFIREMSKMLIEKFDSRIPKSIEELTKLPGVGRKTANVILNDWYNIHEGIAVDTHVKRISYRLALTENKKPEKIEQDLMRIIPKDMWGSITHLLISHGRTLCKAQNPKCNYCFLSKLCPKLGVSS